MLLRALALLSAVAVLIIGSLTNLEWVQASGMILVLWWLVWNRSVA